MKHAKESKITKFMNKVIFNVLYLKIFFVITSFCMAIPIIKPYFEGLLKFGIIWGMAFLIRDFFTKRNVFKMDCIKSLFIFMIAYAISIIINYTSRFSANVSTYVYNFIMVFVLFSNINKKNEERIIEEMKIINYIFIVLTFICSLISLILYAMEYSYELIGQGITYYIGIHNNRLFGIYLNPNCGLSALAICIGMLQFIIEKKNIKAVKAFIILTIIVNTLCMILENSRGIFISFLVFLLTVFLLIAIRKSKNIKNIIKNIAIILVLMIIIISSVIFFKNFISLDRIEKSSDVLSGRTVVWQYGMKKIEQSPLFGSGPKTFADREVLRAGDKLNHFHNILIQSLVSTGIIGTFMFLFASVCIMVFIVKQYRKNKKKSTVTIILIAFIVFSLINNLTEVTIMYIITPMTFLFWIYLGYLMVLVRGEEKNVCNTK